MSPALLVTGATGFIGRHVLRVTGERGISTVALVRSRSQDDGSTRSVKGDLLSSADLDRALDGVTRVLHLAAATGKATTAEMMRTNVDGTRTLIEACERNGVTRLVHVSTIAVNYSDLSDYPYGRSKQLAEDLVRSSGLDWTIVRPTIVLGPSSPILTPLESLATGPALMLPGGGRVQVQPIDVRDVAKSLVGWVDAEAASGKILELGGADRLTMRELLQAIRERAGRETGPALPLPLWGLRLGSRLATAVLGGKSPLTPGQLTAFRFDSVAADLPKNCEVAAEHGIPEMIGA